MLNFVYVAKKNIVKKKTYPTRHDGVCQMNQMKKEEEKEVVEKMP